MLAHTKERIQEVMEQAVQRGETAGVSLLVYKDDQEVCFTATGHANVEQQIPYKRDAIVRLFSMSKPITAAATLLLMERGELDLAEPVCDLLPGFRGDHILQDGKRVPSQHPITVYHLLNMTAGLTYGDVQTPEGQAVLTHLARCQMKMHDPDAMTTKEFILGLGELPLAYEPDTSWSYGLCADVLGAVIETVSGMPFSTFLDENIFKPLGMTDTGFYVPAEKQGRLADAYLCTDGSVRPFTSDALAISYRMDRLPAFESGGGGLVSTIDDYARFARMLLNDGELDGVRVLSPRTVRYMTSGKLTSAQQAGLRDRFGLEGYTYANLLRVKESDGNYSGFSRPSEYGWDGWMGCYFANFPKEKITMILTQQKAESGTIPLTKKLRNVLLSDEELF